MEIQPTVEKKLADWKLAFNSIPNKQSQDAKILKELANCLKEKMVLEGMIVVPGRV